MADIETSSWSETASSNTAAVPNGFPDNTAPSNVKLIVREVMAAIKRDWNRLHPTLASTGSANAYLLGPAAAISGYATGQRFCFKANFSNTGAATLNVSSKGAVAIRKPSGAGLVDLAAGDIVAGCLVEVAYLAGTPNLFVLLTPPVTGISGALAAAGNLSDLTNVAAALANLGLSNVAFLNVSQQFTKGQATAAPIALTDAATVSWDHALGNTFTLSISADRTLAAPTNLKDGNNGLLYLTRNSHSLSLAANVQWVGGSIPALDATLENMIMWACKGTKTYLSFVGTV